MMARLLYLAMEQWVPGRVIAIHTRASTGERIGLLDRWELYNHRRDCELLGRDPLDDALVSQGPA